MMLEDERLLNEKKEFYRCRFYGQLKDSVGLALESLEDPFLADGALVALQRAEKTAEEIGDENLQLLVKRVGAFLASLIVGD